MPRLATLRRSLRPLALWFTRSSHRELLTAGLRSHVEELRGIVVDVGGGRSSPLAQFWPEDATRIRLDISQEYRPDVIGDAQQLPLKSACIDAVIMSEVLEHVREPNRAIAEIYRILRPGAPLHGSVPFAIGVHADPHDYYRYTEESLEYLLRAFHIVEIRPHGNHVGAAWRAINERWHGLWVLNPLFRHFARKPDRRWPVGYTFTARKAGEHSGDRSVP